MNNTQILIINPYIQLIPVAFAIAVCCVNADGEFLQDNAPNNEQRFGAHLSGRPNSGFSGFEHRPASVQILGGGGSRYPPNYPGGSGYPSIGTGHLPIQNNGHGYHNHGNHESYGNHGDGYYGNYDDYHGHGHGHGHHGSHGHGHRHNSRSRQEDD